MLTPKTLVSTRLHIKTNEISFFCSNLNKNGVRSRLAYLENAIFLSVSDLLSSHTGQNKEHMQIKKTLSALFLICQDRTKHTIKSICRLERVANRE
jgi:hypothetical protein